MFGTLLRALPQKIGRIISGALNAMDEVLGVLINGAKLVFEKPRDRLSRYSDALGHVLRTLLKRSGHSFCCLTKTVRHLGSLRIQRCETAVELRRYSLARSGDAGFNRRGAFIQAGGEFFRCH